MQTNLMFYQLYIHTSVSIIIIIHFNNSSKLFKAKTPECILHVKLTPFNTNMPIHHAVTFITKMLYLIDIEVLKYVLLCFVWANQRVQQFYNYHNV